SRRGRRRGRGRASGAAASPSGTAARGSSTPGARTRTAPGDGVDAREEEHADEGAAPPDIEEGDAEEGPGPRAKGAVDAELQRAHEGSVGGGDGRTQGPVPPDHAHARGIRPGEEHGQEYECPTSEGAGEEEGEAE